MSAESHPPAREDAEPTGVVADALRLLAGGAVPPRPSRPHVGTGSPLDDRSRALAGLGALIAIGGSAGTYARLVAEARAAGVSAEEIVDVVVALAPMIGLARVVPCAVEVASALGYDIDRALEGSDDIDDVVP